VRRWKRGSYTGRKAVKTRVIQGDSDAADPDPHPEINQAAPVGGRAETEIDAPREAVWELLADIEDWPSWNPEVKWTSMQDGLGDGSAFRWKAGPGTITSRLEHVDPPRRLAWSGTTFGISALHVYALEPRGEATLVRTEESYEGLPARLFRRRLQKTLDGALANGLRYLKAESERRAAHTAAKTRS
jgi:uncharacterized protein YndB with AHSA1/START domain